MKYFFHCAYMGTNYQGWQKQENAIGIQQIAENAINKILKTDLFIVGCGRTDAGVHASQYFFHTEVPESDFMLSPDFLFRLNKILPDDIAVFKVIPMHNNKSAHSRNDAIERTYEYYLHRRKNPLLANISALYQEENLDFKKMKQACSLLTRYNDYAGLCKRPQKYTTTICNVTKSELFISKNEERIMFRITADRFLYGMVRIIVQQLLDVATSKLSLDELESNLQEKRPPHTMQLSYPQGLYLSKVRYPYLDISNDEIKEDICR